LATWKIERISKGNVSGLTQNLSIQDVQSLKELIQTEVNKARIKEPDVVADQILFLTIGAIQIESQSGSVEAWQLVTKTIRSFSKPDNVNPFHSFAFSVLVLIVCVSMGLNNFRKAETVDSQPVSFFSESNVINTTDPVTISMLHRVYSKMKAGTCQLPHADNLPPDQQHVFLKFVTNGVVDAHHVENLRSALDYVNCLYPQEFLHPTPSYGNTL
jgi:hypothetical protein